MKIDKKGIKQFLLDAKAISPAIATLILIVVAAVAAAGIGMIVQKAQTNTASQTGNQDLSVSGTINIKGSTTVMPITMDEAKAFDKLYPATQINIGGGGSGYGRALVYNKQVDIGASSDVWPDTDNNVDGTTGLTYPGRNTAVLQSSGANAFVNELKIGTSMVVVAANINGVTAINVFNDSGMIPGANGNNITYDPINKFLMLGFTDLKNGYINGFIAPNISGLSNITTVRRVDDSGTQEVFGKWIGLNDPSNGNQLVSTVKAVTKQGNEGVRDYIVNNQNTLGFVDVAFSDNYAANITGQTVMPQGNKNVIAAKINNTAAVKANRGLNSVTGFPTSGLGLYNYQALYVNGKGGSGTNGLGRDLYYYSQPGVPIDAIKAFEDFVMSGPGQTILTNDGFFTPT